MSSAAAWFLVSIATGQYIGPISFEICYAVAAQLERAGVVCRQANSMTACEVPNRPGAYMACPIFVSPQVTAKP
jgi:hypothetical protein